MVPPHEHERAELAYVQSGSISVATGDRLFTVPSGNAIFIPPGRTHEVRMLSDVHVLFTYFPVSGSAGTAEDCAILPVSNLLHELISVAAGLPAAYEPEGRDARLMELVAAEVGWVLAQTRKAELGIPMPTDPRLLRLCHKVVTQLDRVWTLDCAASEAGMGRRTFTRHFRSETGLSFNDWCARTRLNAAISSMTGGASITEVAFEAGYNSPSAFGAMFKRNLGVAPSRLRETILDPAGPPAH